MKALFILLVLAGFTSCQRYVVLSIPEGADVHVQGNQVAVVDTANNFRVYHVRNAYRDFNQYNDVYRLLNQVGDPSLGQGMVHTQSTRKHMRKANRILKSEKSFRKVVSKR